MSGILLIVGAAFNLFILWLFCKVLHWLFVNVQLPLMGCLFTIAIMLLIAGFILAVAGAIIGGIFRLLIGILGLFF